MLVWSRSIALRAELLFLQIAIHMEAVVIPETVDCVRVLCGRASDRDECVRTTDAALGIAKT